MGKNCDGETIRSEDFKEFKPLGPYRVGKLSFWYAISLSMSADLHGYELHYLLKNSISVIGQCAQNLNVATQNIEAHSKCIVIIFGVYSERSFL
jgi:hypothetical protein